MPTITLYGAKSGSGRTTSAAAIALGMLNQGCEVTLVELGSKTNPLARWCAETRQIGEPADELYYQTVVTADDLDALKHEIGIDERRLLIIDTSHAVSSLRSHAFEIADLVLMPFVGLLDARRGVADAKAQLPQGTVLNGLALRSKPDLVAAVRKCMPMILAALPTDERLSLFSDAGRQLVRRFMTTDYDELAVEPGLSAAVSELAAEVRGSACGHQRGYLPHKMPPALAQTDCKLELPQWA